MTKLAEGQIFGNPADYFDIWLSECTFVPSKAGYTLIYDLYQSFRDFVEEQWSEPMPPDFVTFSKHKFAMLLTAKGIPSASSVSINVGPAPASLAALRRLVLKK